jgi:hypothetical protein
MIKNDNEISDMIRTDNYLLFCALMKSHQEISWWSQHNNDGTWYGGSIIAGIDFPSGDIVYILPEEYKRYLGEITVYGVAKMRLIGDPDNDCRNFSNRLKAFLNKPDEVEEPPELVDVAGKILDEIIEIKHLLEGFTW